MITKARAVNFQSHKDTEIEFTEGINIIHGLSDSGKSAFLRSLNSVINKGPFYLNFFETDGNSSIDFSNGDTIKRTFTKSQLAKCPSCKTKIEEDNIQVCQSCGEFLSSNSSSDVYSINGDEKSKFGAKLIENITSVIRMNPLVFGDDEVNVNFSTQHEGMFFVSKDYSSSLRNKMISSLIPDSSRIDDLIKTLNSEKHNVSSALKVYIKQRDVAEMKINVLQPHVDILLNALETFEQTKITLASMEAEYNELVGIECEINNISTLLSVKQSIDDMIATIDDITTQLADRSQKEITFNSIQSIEKQLQSLSIYDNIKVPQVENQSELISSIEDQTKKFLAIKKIAIELSDIKKVVAPELPQLTFPDDSRFMSLKVIESELILNTREISCLKSELSLVLKDISDMEAKLNSGELICPITNKRYCDECIEAIKS